MSDSGQPERVKSGGVSGTCVTKTISSGVWSPDHLSRPTCSFSRPRTIYHNDGNKHTAKSAKCWEHLSKTRKKLLVSNVVIEQKKDSIPSLNSSSFCVNSSGPQSVNKTKLTWKRGESIIIESGANLFKIQIHHQVGLGPCPPTLPKFSPTIQTLTLPLGQLIPWQVPPGGHWPHTHTHYGQHSVEHKKSTCLHCP